MKGISHVILWHKVCSCSGKLLHQKQQFFVPTSLLSEAPKLWLRPTVSSQDAKEEVDGQSKGNDQAPNVLSTLEAILAVKFSKWKKKLLAAVIHLEFAKELCRIKQQHYQPSIGILSDFCCQWWENEYYQQSTYKDSECWWNLPCTLWRNWSKRRMTINYLSWKEFAWDMKISYKELHNNDNDC